MSDGMERLGLTVGDLRLLWHDLPDNVLLDVSFAGINNLVITAANSDPTTPGAHLTVGPITRDTVKAILEETQPIAHDSELCAGADGCACRCEKCP